MSVKLPRDVSGREVCKVLQKIGYRIVHQKGSHIRMRDEANPSHLPVTVPDHLPLDCIRASYINSDIKRLRIYCKVGWRLIEKTDALLESLKDLERALVLAEML